MRMIHIFFQIGLKDLCVSFLFKIQCLFKKMLCLFSLSTGILPSTTNTADTIPKSEHLLPSWTIPQSKKLAIKELLQNFSCCFMYRFFTFHDGINVNFSKAININVSYDVFILIVSVM